MSNKDLEDFLDSIAGLPKVNNNTSSTQRTNPMNGEVDAMSILQQRLMQRSAGIGFNGSQSNSAINPPVQDINEMQKVALRPGYHYFKRIPNDMSNVGVAMKSGMTEDLEGKEMLLSGQGNYLLIEGNNAVDLSRINPQDLKKMVIVKTFWEGEFIVPEAAVVRIGKKSNQILKG